MIRVKNLKWKLVLTAHRRWTCDWVAGSNAQDMTVTSKSSLYPWQLCNEIACRQSQLTGCKPPRTFPLSLSKKQLKASKAPRLCSEVIYRQVLKHFVAAPTTTQAQAEPKNIHILIKSMFTHLEKWFMSRNLCSHIFNLCQNASQLSAWTSNPLPRQQ